MSASRSTWGGRRPGAGRPRKPPLLLPDLPTERDPAIWLSNLMQCADAPQRLRLEAARALLRCSREP